MTELEPVAAEKLARQIWAYFNDGPDGAAWFDNHKTLGGPAYIISLCQSAIAERDARIAELEAAKWQVRHVDTANDLVSMGLARDAAEARAEAAEALLKEAGKVLEPFAQIGDCVLAEAPAEATMWYAGPSCTGEHMAQVSLDYFRAARSLASKIGGGE